MLRKSVGALLGFLLFASGVAFAQNAHFIGTPKASFFRRLRPSGGLQGGWAGQYAGHVHRDC